MARGTVSHCKASRDGCHCAGDAGCSEGQACGVLLKVGMRGDGSERSLVNSGVCVEGVLIALAQACQSLFIDLQPQLSAVSGKRLDATLGAVVESVCAFGGLSLSSRSLTLRKPRMT